ncbi:CLUMA_CG002417, isoform A [Clunio marinus]|uniref:CLUMA_CG002417, isoform A n=1 Tax=Clunio marinus TaxID=568069 RepID=A0A1J1HME8_9DIPT|nr:CLUMA_CG002417, isoform A [Clunio marinus]
MLKKRRILCDFGEEKLRIALVSDNNGICVSFGFAFFSISCYGSFTNAINLTIGGPIDDNSICVEKCFHTINFVFCLLGGITFGATMKFMFPLSES